jgi:hypothetical protein
MHLRWQRMLYPPSLHTLCAPNIFISSDFHLSVSPHAGEIRAKLRISFNENIFLYQSEKLYNKSQGETSCTGIYVLTKRLWNVNGPECGKQNPLFTIFIRGWLTLLACSAIYYRLKTQHIIINKSDNTLQLTSRQHVSAVQQSSSGQSRTQSRYIESVHFMGSRIVYNDVLK